MRGALTGVSIVILLLTLLPAQLHAETPSELHQAMRDRLEAVWKKDAATWARLTADEFTLVIPEGTLMNKDQRLTALKAEKPESSHALHSEQTHVYGDTAVHRFVDGSEWVLEVWHQEKGAWRVVAAQVNFVNP